MEEIEINPTKNTSFSFCSFIYKFFEREMLQKAYLLQKSETEIAIYIEKKQKTFSIMFSFPKSICSVLYDHMKQLPRYD